MRLPGWLGAASGSLARRRLADRFDRREALRRGVRLLGCVALLWGFHGATTPRNLKRLRPGNRPDRAWMNAKGMCVFPLAGDEIPRTGGQLADSLLGGGRGIFALPRPRRGVELAGGPPPPLHKMTGDPPRAAPHPPH